MNKWRSPRIPPHFVRQDRRGMSDRRVGREVPAGEVPRPARRDRGDSPLFRKPVLRRVRPHRAFDCRTRTVEKLKERLVTADQRQHGDETSRALMEMVHILAAGQFAIGHVSEVAAAGQLAEQVPAVAMRLVIGDIAACGAEVQRHAALGNDGENKQPLLQIRTMALVVSEGEDDRQGKTAESLPAAVGVGVGPAESNGGRIVVQFVQGDAEFLDDLRCRGGNQKAKLAAAVAVVLESYSAAEWIVAEVKPQIEETFRQDRCGRPARTCTT